eukprot:gene13340-13468_t
MSTEQFLQAGYAVIFLTRTGSIQPFTQDLPVTEMMPLLQSLVAVEGGSGSNDGIASTGEAVHSKASYRLQEPAAGRVAGILHKVAEVQRAQLLLSIPFTTIFEYLQHLKTIAAAARPYGPQVMFYLAAAVSDFYIPWSHLVEHKIQSSAGPLTLRLHKVPKMMHALRHDWAPTAMIVSFKLETDESILLAKAGGALTRYHVNAVVANLLHTRKDRVLIVQQGSGSKRQQQVDAGHGSSMDVEAQLQVIEVLRAADEPHIEKLLVANIVGLHERFQQEQQEKQRL